MDICVRCPIFHPWRGIDRMLTRTPMKRSKPVSGPKAPRLRKCAVKGCQNRFAPRTLSHKACSVECSVIVGVTETQKKMRTAIKAERAKDAVKRESLKSLSDWIKDVQIVFNKFIRLRDMSLGYPCVSSSRPLNWNSNEVDAGHYRSRGSAPHLRFNEDNCHAQSKQDNRYGAGNAVEYRINLIDRIGIERVEALESNNIPRKYTIAELREIKAQYQAKIKEMKGKQS
jgi:hypothetical protein